MGRTVLTTGGLPASDSQHGQKKSIQRISSVVNLFDGCAQKYTEHFPDCMGQIQGLGDLKPRSGVEGKKGRGNIKMLIGDTHSSSSQHQSRHLHQLNPGIDTIHSPIALACSIHTIAQLALSLHSPPQPLHSPLAHRQQTRHPQHLQHTHIKL